MPDWESMNSKELNVGKVPSPRLRFSEFTGEWSRKPLKDVASVIKRRVGEENHTPMSITSGVGLVSQTDKFGREIAGQQYRNYIVIEKYDFAYNKSATKEFPEGFLAMHTLDETGAVPNSIFTCFRVNNNLVIPQYINYLFQDNLHGRWLRRFISVGARANGALAVETTDLMDLPIPLPTGLDSIQEQIRISATLSSLDAVILSHKSKQEALRQHKQGLMAKLIPSESVREPRLRFSEFEGSDNWEVKKLGEIAEIVTGTTPDTKKRDYYGGKWNFVSPSDISEKRYVKDAKTKLTDLGLSQTRVIPGESIMFVCIGSTIGKLAKSYTTSATNQQINSLIVGREFDSDFIYFSLQLNATRISELAGRQAIPIINKSLFSGFSILLPSLLEQRRISAALSCLDELIEAYSDKIEALQMLKRGLIRGLFPSIAGEK